MATSSRLDTLRWRRSYHIGITTDFDRQLTSGVFAVTDPTGLPVGQYHIWAMRGFEVGPQEYSVKQIAYHATQDLSFVRYYNGTAWSDWEDFVVHTESGSNQYMAPEGVALAPLMKFQPPLLGTSSGVENWTEVTKGATNSAIFALSTNYEQLPRIQCATAGVGTDELAGRNMEDGFLTTQRGFSCGGTISFDGTFTTPEFFFGVYSQGLSDPIPSGIASATDLIGISVVGSDASIVHSDDTGPPTVISLPEMTVNPGDLYEYKMVVSSTELIVTLRDLNARTETSYTIDASTNFPDPTENLALSAQANNGSTVEAVTFNIHGMWARSTPLPF